MKKYLEHVQKALEAASRILIMPHVNPDGDSLGSMAALGHLLAGMGKDVRLYLPAPPPKALEWLPLPWPVASKKADLGNWVPDLVATVDCADAHRVGAEMTSWFTDKNVFGPGWSAASSLNIDHHLGNDGFARVNWVDPGMSSTGEMIGHLSEYCGKPLNNDLGEAVYLALVSDTGNFTFSNTSESCLAMASRILGNGLRLEEFTEKYENTWTLDSMHLWGTLMAGIKLHCEGQIASSTVSLALLKEHNLDKSVLEGFASWLRRISTVKVSIFIREEENGQTKASLRSSGNVDVRAVAARYGGGGHKVAAGVELAMPLEEAEALLVAAAEEALGLASGK